MLPNKEKRHFIDYETKVPKLSFVSLNFMEYKMETLYFLNLNLVWHYSYFYYYSIHDLEKGIHIHREKNPTP